MTTKKQLKKEIERLIGENEHLKSAASGAWCSTCKYYSLGYDDANRVYVRRCTKNKCPDYEDKEQEEVEVVYERL